VAILSDFIDKLVMAKYGILPERRCLIAAPFLIGNYVDQWEIVGQFHKLSYICNHDSVLRHVWICDFEISKL
jgi:hypothetical protein